MKKNLLYPFLLSLVCLISCKNDDNPIDYSKLLIQLTPKTVNLNAGDSCVFNVIANDSSKVKITYELIGEGSISKNGLYISPSNIDKEFKQVYIVASISNHNSIVDTAVVTIFNNRVKTYRVSYKKEDIYKFGPGNNRLSVIEIGSNYIFGNGSIWMQQSMDFLKVNKENGAISKINYSGQGGIMDLIPGHNNEYVAVGFQNINNKLKTIFLKMDENAMLNSQFSNGEGLYTSVCKSDGGYIVTGIEPKVEGSGGYDYTFVSKVGFDGVMEWKKRVNKFFIEPFVAKLSDTYACIYVDTFTVKMLFFTEMGDSLSTRNIYNLNFPGNIRIKVNNETVNILSSYLNLQTGNRENILLKVSPNGDLISSNNILITEDYIYWYALEFVNDKTLIFAKTENNFISSSIDDQGNKINSFSNKMEGSIYGIAPTSDDGSLILNYGSDSTNIFKTDIYGNLRQ